MLLSTLLKWSLNYLSEFLIKRDFSWVLKIHRVVKICKYGKEGRVGYHWKYGEQRAHVACIHRWKSQFHVQNTFQKIGQFFFENFFCVHFLGTNHFNLLSAISQVLNVLWGHSTRFWKAQGSYFTILISIKWFT